MTGTTRNVRDFINNGFTFQKQLDALDSLEKREVDSPLSSVEEIIEPFLDAFPSHKRRHAKDMSRYYEIIYLLENMLREIVIEMLQDDGQDYWNETKIPKAIYDEANRLRSKEIDLGISLRSKENLDYTTFGQLVDIIKHNKEAASEQFISIQGLQRILAVINNVRGPIAHNNLLSTDEVARLYVAVRDLFRLRRT